jgi:hypothetical protein
MAAILIVVFISVATIPIGGAICTVFELLIKGVKRWTQ